MSQFSAHLVCRAEWRTPQQERSTRLAAIYEANAGVLRGQETEAEAKRAQNEVEELKAKVRKLEVELVRVEATVLTCQKSQRHELAPCPQRT
jgi:hypothetical protein